MLAEFIDTVINLKQIDIESIRRRTVLIKIDYAV